LELEKIRPRGIVLSVLEILREGDSIRNRIEKNLKKRFQCPNCGFELGNSNIKHHHEVNSHDVKVTLNYLEKEKLVERKGEEKTASDGHILIKPAVIYGLTQFGYITLLFEAIVKNEFKEAILHDCYKFCPILGKIFDIDNKRMVFAMSNALSAVCRKVYRKELLPENVEEAVVIECIWNADSVLNHEEWINKALSIPEVARIVNNAFIVGKDAYPVFGDESTWHDALKKSAEIKKKNLEKIT